MSIHFLCMKAINEESTQQLELQATQGAIAVLIQLNEGFTQLLQIIIFQLLGDEGQRHLLHPGDGR